MLRTLVLSSEKPLPLGMGYVTIMIKRRADMDLLAEVVETLADGRPLPEKHHDHSLSGDWIGHRECHIEPDWLLIYKTEEEVLVLTLTRTGTHSDLF